MLFPVPEMEPALACHVTAVFDVPVTEATKVCEPPAEILVALGETITEITGGPGGMGGVGDIDFVPVPPPPQDASNITTPVTVVRRNR